MEMQLSEYLARSSATEAFRAALAEFQGSGDPNPRINFDLRAPRIKVERVLTKILQAYPDAPIEEVSIDAVSGCESYRGRVWIGTREGSREISFEWNCRWRAEQLGWADWFGFPDQARAAREFGFDCFRRWEEVEGDERDAA